MRTVRAVLMGCAILAIFIAGVVVSHRQAGSGRGGAPATGGAAGDPDPAVPVAVAASPGQPPAGQPLAAPTAAPAAGTGAAGPDAARWAPLEEHMRWDSRGLVLTTRPDGHATLHGGGRFTHMSAAVRDAAGNRVIQCFSSYADLDATLGGRRPAIPPKPPVDTYEVADY